MILLRDGTIYVFYRHMSAAHGTTDGDSASRQSPFVKYRHTG
ncbi:hypothetical protein [Salinigranum rubrum]|nr:hypothetical protein [Salinigranum rubrum]